MQQLAAQLSTAERQQLIEFLVASEPATIPPEDMPAFLAAVARGRADIAAGRFIDHDTFMAELDAIEEELRNQK